MHVDEGTARQWLFSVSYYRLSAYWHPYRLHAGDSDVPRRLDEFQQGTHFDDVVQLYEFDRKMRTLVHDGLERVEVAMRARIGELICIDDPLAYKDSSRFREEFDHKGWMKTVAKLTERAQKSNVAIKHYETNYGDYPLWVLADVLDFSDISRLFAGLRLEDQQTIAEEFGLYIVTDQLNSKQWKSFRKKSSFNTMVSTPHYC